MNANKGNKKGRNLRPSSLVADFVGLITAP
jgi:hypothetical protein